MSNLEKLVWWLSIVALVGSLSCALSAISNVLAIKKAAFENGYEQVMVPGRTQPIWQKVKEKDDGASEHSSTPSSHP